MTATKFTMGAAGVFDHYADSGPASMTLCILVDGASFLILGLNGATAGVVIITLDRYWKIVHPIHHRKYYRRWMLYVGLVVPWLNGIVQHIPIAPATSKIINGRCYPMAFWPSPAMRKVSSLQHEPLASFCFKVSIGSNGERVCTGLEKFLNMAYRIAF